MLGDIIRTLAVLLPTIGFLWYVFQAIKSAKAKNELHEVRTTLRIIGVAAFAALLFGIVLWVLADFVTDSSDSRANNSSTVERLEELGGYIPELGISAGSLSNPLGVEENTLVDPNAAPAVVNSDVGPVEIVPPVMPTAVPLPKLTFDPRNPPVKKWERWFQGYRLGHITEDNMHLVTSTIFPRGMVCDMTNVEPTAWTRIANEKWEIRCQVPANPDWGKATIPVNGLFAKALGMHTADKINVIRGTGKWPDGAFTTVEPTEEPPNESESTSEDRKRFSTSIELLANQACRRGPSDSSNLITNVSKGQVFPGDPYALTNPGGDARMEIVVPGGTCWIKVGPDFAVQK